MAQLADQYREARMVRAATLIHNKDEEIQSSEKDYPGKEIPAKDHDNKHYVPKSERLCYTCNRLGHIASECRTKPKVGAILSGETDIVQETSSSAVTETKTAA
jgi:hypothetical protein